MTMNDENNDFHDLMTRLTNGDEHAFEELYRRSVASIAFTCHKFCNNHEDAEEAIQDTFTIIFKKLPAL